VVAPVALAGPAVEVAVLVLAAAVAAVLARRCSR
jgi:hypothetical protein